MSKDGIWQDSHGMKDSEMVEKWTKVLHTVESVSYTHLTLPTILLV